MPTTGSGVSPNSVVEASLIPARFRAPSMHAICMPRQMPKNGISRSRANLTLAILPSLPRSPKPPGTRIPCSGSSSATTSASGMLEQLGVDPLDVDLGAVGDAAVDQGLAQALVGVGKADIFADDADRHLAVVMVDAVHDLVPAGEIGLRRVGDPEGAQHFIVEPRLVILQRHVVDVARVERRDDRRFRHVAEQARSFRARVSGSGRSQRHSSTSGWTPRLDSSRTDCCVGLVLSSPAAAIHGTSVVWTLTVWSRPRSFLSWRIDSMNGRLSMSPTVPPISQMTKSQSVGVGQREFLDRVGDVRDDLDRRAEIVAAPLLGDDVAVDAAGGDIVRLA